jgi:hypothetical protein
VADGRTRGTDVDSIVRLVVEEEDVEIKKRQDGQVYIPEHRGISRILRETIGDWGSERKYTTSLRCPSCRAHRTREGRHEG